MFCIYNLYTKEMKRNNNIQIGLLFLLITGISMVNGSIKKTGVNKLPADVVKELIQIKEAQAGTVRIEILPASPCVEKNMESDMYAIRVTLKSNQPVKQIIMEYMNFGIKNSFWLVQGSDTLDCAICERIPGVRRNEFVYMTYFNRGMKKNDSNLRVHMTDTISGFGKTVFDIDSLVLKNYMH